MVFDLPAGAAAPALAGFLGDLGMGEQPGNEGRARRGYGVWAAVAIAGLAAGSVLYLLGHGDGKGAPSAPTALVAALTGLAKGEVAAFTVHDVPADVPAIAFKDADGGEHKLADWKGRLLLLNLWATWCAPCRHEMPALDTLKSELAGKDFDVVALSTDRGGIDKPKKFWTETGIKALGLYLDNGDAQHELGIIGMPTTLLIGRDGREIGRLIGPAEWASADAKALIEAAMKLK
jgi:thiol-disulfide isomerase/thioredoxin